MAGIEWMFTLQDQASAPAKTMTRSIQALTKATQQAERAAVRSQVGLRDAMGRIGLRAQEGVSTLSRAFSSFGGNKVFQALGESARQVGAGITGAFRGIGQSFRRIFNLPSAIVGGFAAWGGKFVLDALGWRESTLAGLDILLGGQERAQAAMGVIERLSEKTTLPMEQISASMEAFLRTGKVTVGESEVMIRSLADVFATAGFKPEVFDAGTDAMRRMLSQTALTSRSLMQVRGLGLSEAVFVQNLAKVLNVAPTQIKEMFAKGQIAGKAGAQALVDTIRDQINRGAPIGTALEAQMNTLPGIFRALRTTMSNFFKRLDIGAMPGLEPLKKFITNIRNILQDDRLRDAAQRAISGIFGILFGPLDKLTTPRGLEGFLNDLPGKVDAFIGKVKRFFVGVQDMFVKFRDTWKRLEPTLSAIGRMFGGVGKDVNKAGLAGSLAAIVGPMTILAPIIGPLGKSLMGVFTALKAVTGIIGLAATPVGAIVLGLAALALGVMWAYKNLKWFRDAVDAVWGALKNLPGAIMAVGKFIEDTQQLVRDFASKLWEAAKKAGGDLVNGLIDGIKGLWNSATDAVGNLAGDIIGKVKGIFGAKSPARVFMGIGEDVTAGLVRGIEGGTGLVARAVKSIMPDIPGLQVRPYAAAPAAVGPGAPSRMPAEINLTVNVDGAAAPKETAEAVAESVTSALAQWFDLLAQEGGGVPVPMPH